MIENKEFLGIITERLESLKGVIGAGAIHGFNNIQGLIFNQIEIIKQTEKHDALHEENDGGTMKNLKDMKLGDIIPKEELGELAKAFNGEVRLLKITYTLQDKDAITADIKLEHKDFYYEED